MSESKSGMLTRTKHYMGRMWDLVRRVAKYGAYERRTYLLRPDLKLLYLSLSKSACSSIKASMLSLKEQDNYQKLHSVIAREGDQQYDLDLSRYADYYKFSVVRNPFDRLVSCYVNKYHTDKALLGTDMTHLYFDYYLMGYLRKDKGFAHFARRVCRIPDVFADKHLICQARQIYGKGTRTALDFVGRFERLSEDYGAIQQKYGLAPLPVYNKTGKGNWMDYYDLQTAARVYKRYRRDIEMFGYEGAYAELVDYLKKKGQSA